jgi:hypothetical protein
MENAHFALHSLLCLGATVIIRLDYEVVEVLHNVFELCLGGENGYYFGVSRIWMHQQRGNRIRSEFSLVIFACSGKMRKKEHWWWKY